MAHTLAEENSLKLEAQLQFETGCLLFPLFHQHHLCFLRQLFPATLSAAKEPPPRPLHRLECLFTAAVENNDGAVRISETGEKFGGGSISQMAQHPLDEDRALFIRAPIHCGSIGRYNIHPSFLCYRGRRCDVDEGDPLELASDSFEDPINGIAAKFEEGVRFWNIKDRFRHPLDQQFRNVSLHFRLRVWSILWLDKLPTGLQLYPQRFVPHHRRELVRIDYGNRLVMQGGLNITVPNSPGDLFRVHSSVEEERDASVTHIMGSDRRAEIRMGL